MSQNQHQDPNSLPEFFQPVAPLPGVKPASSVATSTSNLASIATSAPGASSAPPKPGKVAGQLKFSSEKEAAFVARETPNRQTTRVFDVPVVVDEAKCITGCHVCVESCPVDCLAIDLTKGKSHMKFDECWYCLACEVDCPTNAITVKIPYLVR